MARPCNPVPRYLKHPTKNEARCWTGGRWISLGRYDSEESLREYERVCARVRKAAADTVAAVAAGAVPPPSTAAAAVRRRLKGDVSVSEVVVAFMRHAAQHYRGPDGRPATEVAEYAAALQPLSDLYGETPAGEFGPLALQAVRRVMIDQFDWCRNRVNRQTNRVRHVFKWAAGQELVSPAVHAALACVAELRKGKTDARESEKVTAVPRAVVVATLRQLNRQVVAMVELQLCTAMRPGEVMRMTLGQIERPKGKGRGRGKSAPWVYRPARHKTAHKGIPRTIPLGPRAQAIITRHVGGPVALERRAAEKPNAPLFSPVAAREERYAKLRATRKTKVQPSQVCRRKANPKRRPAEWYDTHGYCQAVRRAAERAGVQHWHPHQVRHLVAGEVRKRYGLEAAQVLLGHAKMNMTEHYAEKSLELAVRVAGEMG